MISLNFWKSADEGYQKLIKGPVCSIGVLELNTSVFDDMRMRTGFEVRNYDGP